MYNKYIINKQIKIKKRGNKMIETTLFMTGKENEEQLADFNKKRALALNLMGYVIIKTPGVQQNAYQKRFRINIG